MTKRLRDEQGRYLPGKVKKKKPKNAEKTGRNGNPPPGKDFRFKIGNPGGPGRPRSYKRYIQEEISLMEGLDPKSDDYLRVMAQLHWFYAKRGDYAALRDMIEREFGKVADKTEIIHKIQIEVVYKIGAILPRAMLQAGASKQMAGEAIDNMIRITKAEFEANE